MSCNDNALGSDWRIPTTIRYLEARGNPGAVQPLGLRAGAQRLSIAPCPEPMHSIATFEPVFPTGSRYFCVLKPGYPGADSILSKTRETIVRLCDLMEEVHYSHSPRRLLPWELLCSLSEEEVTWNTLEEGSYPLMMLHLGHLVGLQLSALGLHGTFPGGLLELTMLIELDLSRNDITGMCGAMTKSAHRDLAGMNPVSHGTSQDRFPRNYADSRIFAG